MATFTFEVSGDEEMQMLLNRMENLDTTGLMENLSEKMYEQTRDRLYYTKTAPDGTPWAPWSERYDNFRKHHKKHPYSGGKLILSSDLFKTIYSSRTKTTAVVGSNRQYANTHQEGNPNKNIPARPFLGTSPEDLNELHDSGVAYLEALFGVR